MIKLIYCITKKAGISDQEFARYWREVHGPIGARIPGLRRLVQSHVVEASRYIRRPDYDGVVELWFDDLAALIAARESVEYRLSTEDEANFVDSSRTAFLITREYEIPLPGESDGDRDGPDSHPSDRGSGSKRGSS